MTSDVVVLRPSFSYTIPRSAMPEIVQFMREVNPDVVERFARLMVIVNMRHSLRITTFKEQQCVRASVHFGSFVAATAVRDTMVGALLASFEIVLGTGKE